VPRLRLGATVTLWGVPESVTAWLGEHGVAGAPLAGEPPAGRQVILVGDSAALGGDLAGWREVMARVDRGAVALFLAPEAFARRREKAGVLAIEGIMSTNAVDVPIANVPAEAQAAFRSEVQGDVSLCVSELPDGDYTVELGFCELSLAEPEARLFDVAVNGQQVLAAVDVYRAAGGRYRAWRQRFPARPAEGQVRVQLTSRKNLATVSLFRLYDSQGALLVDSDQPTREKDRVGWLPLSPKGQCNDFWDWLYHREFVARPHPVFAGMPARGILDWDYYGPVLPGRMFTGQQAPDEVAAAAFAVGYPCPGGYVSGIVLGEYRFGAGRFWVNTFRILANVGRHPAADQLLAGLLRHAARTARPRRARPGRDLEARLAAVGCV